MITYMHLTKNGQLGNQLFRIASTIGIAAQLGHPFVFSKWPYTSYMKNPLPQTDQEFLRMAHMQFNEAWPGHPQFSDGQVRFEPKNTQEIWNLRGHYQNEKYFLDCRPTVRHFLTLKDEIHKPLVEAVRKVKEKFVKLYSLHVRRGDYVGNPWFFQLDVENYYKPVYEQTHGPGVGYLVFSDDLAWCRENLARLGPNVLFWQSGSAVHDLYGGSLCDAHIISNSTFSWWTAWLGEYEQPGKEVIAPSRWFGPGLIANDLSRDIKTKILPQRWRVFEIPNS